VLLLEWPFETSGYGNGVAEANPVAEPARHSSEHGRINRNDTLHLVRRRHGVQKICEVNDGAVETLRTSQKHCFNDGPPSF
jgi:hypothetical protein